MKAIVCIKHGPPDVLELHEVDKPVPQNDQVLIQVHAATVTAGDIVLRKLHPLLFLPMRLFGVKRKKTPGHEFAGRVQAVGQAVTRFKVGDEVFGTTTGLSVGANAEYVCLPETWKAGAVVLKPANLSYEEAAAVPVGGMTALYILKKGAIQPGQQVLINGASGSVGTYAVQLAKYFGAVVTGVCSARNLELVRSLGADQVIDYTEEDFTAAGRAYDVIFDAVGKLEASRCKGALKENGVFLTVRSTTQESPENLAFLIKLLEAGEIKPVIDRRYPLNQVADAHRYAEAGHKRGNVVIVVDHGLADERANGAA